MSITMKDVGKEAVTSKHRKLPLDAFQLAGIRRYNGIPNNRGVL
jgi:hypothetical protein